MQVWEARFRSLPSRLRASAEWRLAGVLPRASAPLTGAWWTLIVVRGGLPAAFTLSMGALVGAVQRGRPATVPLLVAGAVFVAINALGPLHEAVGADLGARAGGWLRGRLIRACLAPPGLAHLESPELADELAKARDLDSGMAGPAVAQAIPQLGSFFAAILGGFVQAGLLARYAWWAALLLAAAWTSTHFLLRNVAGYSAFGAPAVVRDRRHVEYAYRLAVDAPAAKEVRLFGLADWVVGRFADRRRRLVELFFRERRLQMTPLRWGLGAIVVANAAVFASLGRDAAGHAIDLGSLVVYVQAALGTSAIAVAHLDFWLRSAARPVPVVLDLAERMTPVGALPSGTRAAGGLPAERIAFRDVHFRYGPDGAPVLAGLDLEIPAGASLAIVGANGAGKTTLAKLLCRFYDPQRGAVLADGIDIRELDVPSWRSRIAALFQDFIRYELPLRENVAPAGASDEDVRWALERAADGSGAGLDTVLSKAYEGGTDLSGGQWQRVALARALCSVRLGAGVVILDEPTAQLDVRGETAIFDRLLESTRGCTTILISHRFSTVRRADRIAVLEGGRVSELGTHDELMARGGGYRRMFELQAARFSEQEADGVPL